MSHTMKVIMAFATCVVAALLSGCRQQGEQATPPPPMVTVSRPIQQTVTDYAEFTGTTEAVESVNIRARVEGFLEAVHFQAAAVVEQGDLLFTIDPRPFRAVLDRAEAQLENRQAELRLADHDYHRIKGIYESQSASEFEWVKAQSDFESAQAAVREAQAAVDEAALNLGYTQIHAPISGQISRTFIDPGNLVGAGEYTLLTTIVSTDPVYAYFNASERVLLEYLATHPEKRRQTEPQESAPLYLGLANERGYPHEGRSDWGDNRVDPDTGTIQVRGVFPNPDDVLIPGLFVRLRAPIDTRENALLIPNRALGADQGGRYLLIVNAENVVEKRYVEVGALVDELRVIEQGLAADDSVIVRGVQRAREGMTVSPMPEGEPAPVEPGVQSASPESEFSE